MPTLSVIIITKNEAHDIRQTLESVRWADEIVVLDSGSTDNTVAICHEYTDKVFVTDWPGFGPQKNRALQHATSDWVFSLDADERVSTELQQQIREAIKQNNYAGFNIPRVSTFCGKLIKHGAWRAEQKLRLFKRGAGQFSDDLVHEKVIVTGNIGHLSALLWHDTYQNLDEMLEKLNRYTTISAEMRAAKNKTGSLTKAMTHSLWAFIYSYLVRFGFLDGKEGFMIAVMNAETSYYRYLKLMYLQSMQRNKQ